MKTSRSGIISVELTISSTNNKGKPFIRTVEVEAQKNDADTMRIAELQYCNEYINRDVKLRVYKDLSQAKRYACLRILSRIL